MFVDVDGIVGDDIWVYHTSRGETTHSQGFWDELGGWDMLRGCEGGSPSVFCCSRAVVCGPEWGRAGEDTVIIDACVDDVAECVDA